MYYDRDLVAAKLRRWEKYLDNYKLPTWDEIPDLGLYMDQVVALLTQYLDYLPPEIKEERCITASTINNYVRLKAMPEPKKKKYYRVHIAYLVMICTLKQTLSIALVKKLIPMDIAEDEFIGIYNSYVQRHRATAQSFVDQIRIIASPILHQEDDGMSTKHTSDLISESAIAGGFYKLLAEKLLLLEGMPEQELQKEE